MINLVNSLVDRLRDPGSTVTRDEAAEEIERLTSELDRCRTILKRAGLDGARGAAMLPTRQTIYGSALDHYEGLTQQQR